MTDHFFMNQSEFIITPEIGKRILDWVMKELP